MQIYSTSAKSKFVDPKLDTLCCGWVSLVDGKCPKCKKIYNKAQIYNSLRKRFELVNDLNRDQFSKRDIDNLIIPIKISSTYYGVPVSAFKAFDNITSYEKHNEFFEMVQRTCNKIQYP